METKRTTSNKFECVKKARVERCWVESKAELKLKLKKEASRLGIVCW